MRGLKAKHLGWEASDLELKGGRLFSRFYFRLEKKGVRSTQLDFARDVLSYCERIRIQAFASIIFDKMELDLACANANQLDRPFFYLFERINQFMVERHPDKVAKIVFDDRGFQTNEKVSKSVSNFFHKSSRGKQFEHILKIPFFGISNDNNGIQLADIFGHAIGRMFTGDKDIREFYDRIKKMEFISQAPLLDFDGKVLKDEKGQNLVQRGFRAVRERGGNSEGPK